MDDKDKADLNLKHLKHLEQVRDRYIREYKNDEITTREFVETVADILPAIRALKNE